MNSVRQATTSVRARLPRTSKLTKPIEFKRVFKNNVVSSDRLFKVLGRPNDGPCYRLGMAVSRQIDKRSVGRNRIKRVIRESFRYFSSSLEAVPAGDQKKADGTRGVPFFVDLVVLPRRECATICNRQMFLSLETHWSRISRTLERKREQAELQSTMPGKSGVKQEAGTT